MEKKYLTISEFAGLRNVSIGSLRYYEKLQILTPARVDPHTGYRYYLPEQLITLDSILMCIALDIPLKELKNYVDDSGSLDQESILTRGKDEMQSKISEMQTKLRMIQQTLDIIGENQKYSGYRHVYTRRIAERFLIEEPFTADPSHIPTKDAETRPMLLFKEAQDKQMVPTFPAGLIIHYDVNPPECCFYFQVMHPDMGDPRIIRIPEGEYPCLQSDLNLKTDVSGLLSEHFPNRDGKLLIISNMLLGKMHFDMLHSEIQLIGI